MGFFEHIAEFHEFFMIDAWEGLAPRLESSVAAPGRVVEIGAGSGLGTLTMSRLWPEAHVVAVEPDAAMRAILMGRLAGDAALRSRVEVLPLAVAPDTQARLAALVAADADLVVVAHLIGILDEVERAALFAVARAALGEAGELAITVGQPHAHGDEDAHGPQVRTARLGRQRIEEEWQPGRVRYRHLDRDGEVLAEVEAVRDHSDQDGHEHDHHHEPLAAETVIAEATAAGFELVSEDADGLLVFTVGAPTPARR